MDLFAPLQWLADLVSYSLLGLAPDSYLGAALNFFIYDSLKIGLLLVAINLLMAVVRYYLPLEKARDILTRPRWQGVNYLVAALLGVVTPFCSCSSIPLFIGFLSAGIPLGITFTFLISSPLVNEASLYLFPALFGFKVTLLYNLIGIVVAILGGLLIQSLGVERFVRTELLTFRSRKDVEGEHGSAPPLRQLLAYFWQDAMTITRQVFPYVLLGVGLGAVIHGFVPASLAERFLSSREWWAVPLATLLGVPFYANSVGVIPVMEALVGKGVPLGTGLAFMTAIVTLSLPEMLILKKVMRWQLLALFIAVTTVGIMLIGYGLNALTTRMP